MSLNILSASITLTSDQILSLAETPVTIISSPGAGLYVNIIALTIEYVFKTTPYSVADSSETFNIVPAGRQASILISVYQAGLVDQTVSSVAGLSATLQAVNNDDNAVPMATYKNEAIQINASEDVTDGDGTMVVTIYYAIETAV